MDAFINWFLALPIMVWICAHPYETIGLALVPILPLALFNLLAVLVVMERRGAAFIQDRPGPNRAGIWIPFVNTRIRGFGTVLNLADFIKLVMKEQFDPKFASFGYYAVGPIIPLAIALIIPAFLPFFAPIAFHAAEGGVAWLAGQNITSNSGLLLLFAFSSLSVYGIVLGSWASNSKYALLGGMRASAMMISYEVSIGLAAAGMFLIVGSFDLAKIVSWQGSHVWGCVVQPVGFILFTVAMFAECNRNPFDVVEGDSEIVAGFHTEYGAMRFMLFMSAEYFHLLLASLLIATLFLGGYNLFPIPLPIGQNGEFIALDNFWVHKHLGLVLSILLGLGAVGLAVAALLVHGRRTWYSRIQASDAALRAKEYLLYIGAFSSGAVVLAVLAWLATGWTTVQLADTTWGWKVDLVVALVQASILVGKALLIAWLFVWVRWTLPRFRYDQIMALGWKVLLNIALLNLLITAVIAKLVA
ncbi:MAG: complex I subunit 1 family protein [Planctomycetota bacterium]